MCSTLDLSDNNLDGALRTGMGQLVNLECVCLVYELPFWSEFFLLVFLTSCARRTLDFSHNKFAGTLPAEFLWMRKLKVLRLKYNQLWGSLPYRFGDLNDLMCVYCLFLSAFDWTA